MEIEEKKKESLPVKKVNNLHEGEKNFEVERLAYLAYRSEDCFKSDLKKHVDQFNGARIFSGVNMFSAFKSTTDYFIAEFGRGYAIFVDGKLKNAERDMSKPSIKIPKFQKISNSFLFLFSLYEKPSAYLAALTNEKF